MAEGVTMKFKVMPVEITKLKPNNWSTTQMTKREFEALKLSIEKFGQLQPIVVRSFSQSPSDKLEVIDGMKRVNAIVELKRNSVDVIDVGQISDCEAMDIHLSLNLDRGTPARERLASAIEVVIDSGKDAVEKARLEQELMKTLPIPKTGVQRMIEKLKKKVPHREDAEQSWIDFKFKVEPQAAKVCDRALSAVEKSQGVKRSSAFELICADFLAGNNG